MNHHPTVLILHATGSNRDLDVAEAIEMAGGVPHIRPLNQLRAERTDWSEFQMLVLPGGFAYADALGAGKLLAIDLNSYFSEQAQAFVEQGKPVIGICNGFQTLVKAGLLPGASGTGQGMAASRATLTFNRGGHFECRWVTLLPVSNRCLWTSGLTEPIECPVAHGEGNFVLADPADLTQLQANDQIGLMYATGEGLPAAGTYPANPNGSIGDIAGVCNAQGNVLGLMPHPENHIHPFQHPRWTRGERGRSGLRLFENGVRFVK